MSTRRILIIENSGKVDFGGGQKITLQVAEILNEIYELVFVDFAINTRFRRILNEQFLNSPKISLRARSFSFSIKYINWILEVLLLICFLPLNLKRIKYYVITGETIVYVTTKKGLLYAFLLKIFCGIPYIYHAHLVEKTNSCFYPLYLYILKKANVVLCVSKAVYNTVASSNRILLYNPSLNFKGFKGFKTGEKLVIAAIGSLIEIKGFEYYIEAANLMSINSHVEFRLYGDGPLRNHLKSLSQGNVKFMGFCEDIINEMYASIDVVVVPTIIPEALPLVLVESKSVGIPAIVTNLGGQSEIVRDGIDGFLVSTKNSVSIKRCIEMMVDNRGLYNELAKEAYQSVSIFDYNLFKSIILKNFVI